MQTLFAEMEEKQDKILKIKVSGQKVLSKNQPLFNNLTKRIETLEKEIILEEKLKIYISTLKQQVVELQQERMRLSVHPRYEPIVNYSDLSENYAVNKIVKYGKMLKSIQDSLNEHILFFNRPEAKKFIIKYCKDFSESVEGDSSDTGFWRGF